ncbi:hypothetical protein [Nannocystis pusilla]|uniref:Ig-like domain-containing protein n=1 Tax=Nannocystis pusilla TaxID=889268 RepID=A0ABS7U0H5_9BACT|nr:hypothetical protein [Nannocystis pusilla]MBZ5714022.1 hypothetical protein [Nannocystis pusilla]
MRNKFIALVSTFSLTAMLGATVALAASVHLKGGANAEPSFTDLGLALQASGALAGLGAGDIVISLAGTGQATAVCVNPSGVNQPPGQNPAPITLTGTEPISEGEIKNGNVSFVVQTDPAPSSIAGAPGCPNSRWTENVTAFAFTAATITVTLDENSNEVVDPGEETLLTVTCTFSQPTSNGPVPQSNVINCV